MNILPRYLNHKVGAKFCTDSFVGLYRRGRQGRHRNTSISEGREGEDMTSREWEQNECDSKTENRENIGRKKKIIVLVNN